ncbi:MAG: zinc-dependent metalloprotease [Chloroflexota bacterium]
MSAAGGPRRSASGGAFGRGRSIRDDRLAQAGFLLGAAVGAVATVIGNRAERAAREGGLVDWRQVEAIAIARLRSSPGTLPHAELRAAKASYDEAMAEVVPALQRHLGSDLPGVVERVAVVDRAGWVRANTATFAALVGKLETELLDQLIPRGGGFGKAAVALANRWVTSRQLGLLLGFMGQRVLGQYDLALLSAEATPGQLLFVEENVRQTAAALDVPIEPFRTWIALHETTHAFEFEAHPWLRPYLAERLERQLTLFSRDASTLGRDAVKTLGRALRGDSGDAQHWLERLMNDEQRRLFRETQAVMSLLEGFGDHVMDEVGKELVPGVSRISARFHERRERRTPFERAILRLTGMDLKMEQYKKGERFVAAIAERGGPAALRMLWSGPETLPLPEEIDAPDRWLGRVGLLGRG